MKKLFLWIVVLYLRFWAHIALRINNVRVIGIAGSVGKSSTRNILYTALKDNAKVKNIFGNSETGIPLGILGIKPEGYDVLTWLGMLLRAPFGIFYIRGSKWIIVEMGIDEPYPPRNMQYLLSIVRPDIAISLNISATHTQQFEILLREERYKNIIASERYEFLLKKIAEDDVSIITKSGCDVGIYNRDDEYIAREINEFENKKETKLLSFGTGGDVEYEGYKLNLEKTVFEFVMKQQKISVNIEGYVLPKEYREVIAACLLAASEVGVDVEKAARSIEKNFTIPKGRSSILEGINGSVIIDSSYNASRTATIAFLKMIKKLKKQTEREVVFLFGDMRELGREAEREHEEVNNYIRGVVDYLYCVGPLTEKYVMPEFEKKNLKDLKWFENSLEAGVYLKANIPSKALVLVKGSQNTIFLEEAVKQILRNENDTNRLCRQEGYWMSIKKN